MFLESYTKDLIAEICEDLQWNMNRRTKALGFKSPNEVLAEALIRALAFLQFVRTDANTALYRFDSLGNAHLQYREQKPRKKIRTRKLGTVEKYLEYLEWEEGKKNLLIFFTYPTTLQNFSKDSFKTELALKLRFKFYSLRRQETQLINLKKGLRSVS